MASLSLHSTPVRYFLEVAQAGSVNQAASRLFVAPSAVSRQIAKLEDGLGAALFERQARGMVLTAAGQRLAAHLRHAVADAGQMLDQVRQLGQESSARVRLCCTEGFATDFMPAFMQDFWRAQPGSRVELLVGAPDAVSQWLLRGEADIGLKYAVAPEPGLRVEHSARAPVLAVMAPDHPLAASERVALADVVRHPLLVGSAGVTARQLFDLACNAQGLRYHPVFVSNFSSVMLPLLRSPQILLSGLLTVAHRVREGSAVARPFSEATVLRQRRLQVLSLEGRTLSPPLRACVDALARAIAEAAPPG
ncbi:LysR family transcriptional regulator [Paracidovorax anthurii]|uniref:LysR family transcriptional regulator n=1 Tax=Paracidovorax anthurii TaxID=78229 RepID=A0A328YWK0_9BURK|nr:LysR family transcriptional regulator [Paracidovorax anthurii]RAR76582.1 LysR family transcriptional regulator [Paracidovorax anthurii]WCM95136.1 LysR family transcriptional regulator [Acidovorax sp. NCPPB 2350]